MKKCCKDIDITDAYQIEPFIEEGYFKQSNSYNSYARFNRASRYAQKIISKHERNKQHGTSSNIICFAAQNYISANG